MSEHRLDGKDGGYSPTTIKRVHALISSILSTAVQWNVILSNPCVRVKPPKQLQDTSDIQYFTEEETAAFLQFLSDGTEAGEIKLQYNIFYQIAIFCGLRRGESIALLWSDIDFEAKTMSIQEHQHSQGQGGDQIHQDQVISAHHKHSRPYPGTTPGVPCRI